MNAIRQGFASNTVKGIGILAATWWLESQGIVPSGTTSGAAQSSGVFPAGGLGALLGLAQAVGVVVTTFGLRNLALKAAAAAGSAAAPAPK